MTLVSKQPLIYLVLTLIAAGGVWAMNDAPALAWLLPLLLAIGTASAAWRQRKLARPADATPSASRPPRAPRSRKQADHHDHPRKPAATAKPARQRKPAKPKPTPLPPPSPASAPKCPHCKGPMIVKQARSGANAGGEFWGCAKYPKCRGMRLKLD